MGLFWSSESKNPLVLVVDDDAGMRQMLVEMLEMDGYRTAEAVDGQDALSAAKSKRPQLILLDMIMPGLGGLDTLKALKAEEKTKNIPVIMVTGEQKGKDIETCFGWGAVSYVIKPVRTDMLRTKVRQALGLPEK